MSNDIIIRPFDDLEHDVFEALNMVTSGVSSPEQWLIDALGGGTSASGTKVNFDSVISIPAAWNSINLIAGHLSAMPKEVRRTLTTGGSELVTTSPAYTISNMWCSDLYTPFTFWQTLMTHALVQGNGRAFISRDGNQLPSEMTLILPNTSWTVVVGGDKWHVCWFSDDMHGDVVSPRLAQQLAPYARGSVAGGGTQYYIPDQQVLHVPGLGYNGLWGYPLEAVAKDTFGLELAGLEAVSYSFNNAGRPGLLLTAPKGMFRTDKEAREFMTQFTNTHEGNQNRGRTGMLREGMGATTLDAVDSDSGLSTLRDKSEDDIAKLFGTEYLMGESSAVYKDLPTRMAAYVTNTLLKWMETIEAEGNRKLLTERQYRRQGLYFHLKAARLLRGSPTDLATYTGQLRTQGLINGDEGREYHDLNPAGLKDYGNPNVSGGSDDTDQTEDEEEETEEEEEEEQTSMAARLATAVEGNFKPLIINEQRRIKAIAGQSNFIEKAEKFYDGMEDKLFKVCDALDVDRQLAQQHINESKTQLIEVCGVVSPDQLPSVISDLVDDWGSRSSEFAKCYST